MKVIAHALASNISTIPIVRLSNTLATYDDDTPIVQANGKYYPVASQGVKFSADLIGEDDQIIDENIALIKLVAERHSDDRPNGEEIYLTGSIVNGHLAVSGTFPTSTNYKISAGRNNRALERLFVLSNIPFLLSFDTLDFLA